MRKTVEVWCGSSLSRTWLRKPGLRGLAFVLSVVEDLAGCQAREMIWAVVFRKGVLAFGASIHLKTIAVEAARSSLRRFR